MQDIYLLDSPSADDAWMDIGELTPISSSDDLKIVSGMGNSDKHDLFGFPSRSRGHIAESDEKTAPMTAPLSTQSDWREPQRRWDMEEKHPLVLDTLDRPYRTQPVCILRVNVQAIEESNPSSVAPQRPIYKSTGTHAEDFTVFKPNVPEIMYCIAAILQAEIIASLQLPDSISVLPEFDVEFTPPADWLPVRDEYDAIHGRKLPPQASFEFIVKFISNVYDRVQYPPECNIIALVYVNRFMELGKMSLTPRTWTNIWIATIIVAQKMWDDRAFKTSAFLSILPGVTKHALRDMEWKLLDVVNFDISVKSSLYASYYFEMRHMYEEFRPGSNSFKLKPLSGLKERQLAERSYNRRLVRKPGHKKEEKYPSRGDGGECMSPKASPTSGLVVYIPIPHDKLTATNGESDDCSVRRKYDHSPVITGEMPRSHKHAKI
jgi:hypothetical protein